MTDECNGKCRWRAERFMEGNELIHADPDCPVHGTPQEPRAGWVYDAVQGKRVWLDAQPAPAEGRWHLVHGDAGVQFCYCPSGFKHEDVFGATLEQGRDRLNALTKRATDAEAERDRLQNRVTNDFIDTVDEMSILNAELERLRPLAALLEDAWLETDTHPRHEPRTCDDCDKLYDALTS